MTDPERTQPARSLHNPSRPSSPIHPLSSKLQPPTSNLQSPIPDHFQFSQAKLQDYVDCPRRFQLRYVLMQPWPALITEPASELEQHMQRGAHFHHLAHQYALGLPPERLAETIHDETLARWWQTFLHHHPSDLPSVLRRAEVILSASWAGYRLVAKYDLLAVEPGQRFVVVDWKTVLKRPTRAFLARRLQTLLYRFLAVQAGATYNGERPQADQVEMVYWFAAFRGATERFPYDTHQCAGDGDYLSELITQITAHREPIWPLAADERHCRFCKYRSLCERGAEAGFLAGVEAGYLADLDEDPAVDDFEIDLEQIAEIEF